MNGTNKAVLDWNYLFFGAGLAFVTLIFVAFVIENHHSGGVFYGPTILTALAALFFGFITVEAFKRGFGSLHKDIDKHRATSSEAALASFGNTPDLREKAFQAFFDQGTGDLSISDLAFTGLGHELSATIAKNIGTLQPASRECLRIVYLLLNRGLLTADNFVCYASVFLFDRGNCTITNESFPKADYKNVKEMLARLHEIRGIHDPSVAENNLRSYVEQLFHTHAQHPTIRLIQNRLSGGNSWMTTDDLTTNAADMTLAGITETAFQPHREASKSTSHGEHGERETAPSSGFYLGFTADDSHGQGKSGQGSDDDVQSAVFYTGEGSLVTLGPPGSGKTQCHAIPNLLLWQDSAVVLDVKGDLFAVTSKVRSNFGKVVRFSPFEKPSARYNPLSFLPGADDPNQTWVEAQFLASMLQPHSSKGGDATYWEGVARNILQAVIAYVAITYPPEQRQFGYVLDVTSGLRWKEFMTGLEAFSDPNGYGLKPAGRFAANFREIEQDSPNQFAGSRSSADHAVSTWNSPAVERATEASDWSPEDLHGDKPVTVYITATPEELMTQAPFFRVILGQHVSRLLQPRFLNAKRPILFMIDEFPTLGVMPPIEQAMMVGRQYGLRLWLLAQTIDQITRAYGDARLLKSAAVRSYIRPDFETAKNLSEQLGDRAGAFDTQRQPLATPQDLSGAPYENLIVTMATGKKPLRLHRSIALTQPLFAEQLGSITPEEASAVMPTFSGSTMPPPRPTLPPSS